MTSILAVHLSLVLAAASQAAASSKPADGWGPWQFLVGEWEGDGGGKPGQGSGAFSFRFELEGKVLVRRNRSDYPASEGRPAVHHEDLMVIYAAAGGKSTRAIYFDNEGHVINYTAEFSPGQNILTFSSDPSPSAPAFRLTYTKAGKDRVTIRFEIAPPGKPEALSTYLEGGAHRLHSP